MPENLLYSIGHGSRKIENFLSLLREYQIQYLADVRSYPQSRFHPQFNRKALQQSMKDAGIMYMFMGDLLGGRPNDLTCYTNNQIDYSIVQAKGFYKQGIAQLKSAYEKKLIVAIMCSERNPCDCHRSRLIGKTLSEENITLWHIDEAGKLVEQTSIMNKLKSQGKLF